MKVHTNPILLCFISILYYKNLDEHIQMYRFEKYHMNNEIDDDEFLNLKKFKGRLAHHHHSIGFKGTIADDDVIKKSAKSLPNSHKHDEMLTELKENKKVTNKMIVNRWHVFLILSQNMALIQYRKHNIKKIPKDENKNMINEF